MLGNCNIVDSPTHRRVLRLTLMEPNDILLLPLSANLGEDLEVTSSYLPPEFKIR
jgi:hypothetical protein